MKNQAMAVGIVMLALMSGVLEQRALAQTPVTISGFVADLTGEPHDRPNITIRIRSVRTNREIATGVSDDKGFFSIPIDPNDVTKDDVTVSITADGTAFIQGNQTAVRTNGTLFGLAGAIDTKHKAPIVNGRVTQFIVLVVPAENCYLVCDPVPCCRPRGLLRSRR